MKVTRFVPSILFGEGAFDDLNQYVDESYPDKSRYVIYVIDAIHRETGLAERLNAGCDDLVVEFDASSHEPKTSDIDEIRDGVVSKKGDELPRVVVGVGGGSTMDVAKAVSIMLTSPGSSAEYQGLDLVEIPPVPKIAVPTLSGTGAEATRTAVLTGPEKKFGINSNYSIYDAILLDPKLLTTVPTEQEFYTGMDNFIHCVEALNGSAMNAMGRPFALQAKASTQRFFMGVRDYGDFMVGSFQGGCSIANSSVGICHALSYGIAFVYGYRHGIANSIVFNQLEEFYGEDVVTFRNMVEKNGVEIPSGVTRDVTEQQLDEMIRQTDYLKKDLISALGENYKEILTREKLIEIYKKM